MRNTIIVDRLISQRWPELKKWAEQETDQEALIALIEEIDDLLVLLERRIAAIDIDTALQIDKDWDKVGKTVLAA
jgi:hemerythrin superfamily protein